MLTMGIAALVCALGATPARAAPSTLVVRLDDRKDRALQDPWVTVVLADGTRAEAPATDDGSDPEDRFAGDRLYIARLAMDAPGSGTLYLTVGGPAGTGLPLRDQPVTVGPGRDQLQLRSMPPAATNAQDTPVAAVLETLAPPPLKSSGADAPPDGPPQEAARTPAPLSRDALVSPQRLTPGPWPAPLLALLAAWLYAAWAARRTARRVGSTLVARLLEISRTLEGMTPARPPPLRSGRSMAKRPPTG